MRKVLITGLLALFAVSAQAWYGNDYYNWNYDYSRDYSHSPSASAGASNYNYSPNSAGASVYAPTEIDLTNKVRVNNDLNQRQRQSQFGAVLGIQKGPTGSGNDTRVSIEEHEGDITYEPAANGTPVAPGAPTAECIATWGVSGGAVVFTGGASGWKYSVPCLYGEVARRAFDAGQRDVAFYAIDRMLYVTEEIASRNGYDTPALVALDAVEAEVSFPVPSNTPVAFEPLTSIME